MLSPSSKSYQYSLANRYYDYILAGIPAIHMDFPEYRNAMQAHHTGILLQEYSKNALIDGVKQIISDPKSYEDMSQNCKLSIQENNWDNEEKRLIEIYDSV